MDIIHSSQSNITKGDNIWIIIFTPKRFTDYHQQHNVRI